MNDAVKVLELDEILKRAATYARSSKGRDAVSSVVPSSDMTEVRLRLDRTHQASILLTEYRFGGTESFDDITEVMEKTRAGAVLSMGDLLRIATVLRSAGHARKSISVFPDEVSAIKDIAQGIFTDEALEKDIRRDILSDSEMSDTASPDLRRVRTELRRMKARLVEKLTSYTRSNEYSDYLRDNFYTIRAGRYVLPVKNECRKDVPGLLHDLSSTGSTAYIEPFEIVSMNNDIVRLEGEEQREVEKVLAAFTERVITDSDLLTHAFEGLVLLDTIFALAQYSLSINGIMPDVSFAGSVALIKARHPLLDPAKAVPIDIEVGTRGCDILLISGPNTGGKTVSLKTVGLLSLMAGCGLLVPCAEGSKLSVFDRIFCDIGDDQDISRNLSTFSSHIANLKEIATSFTDESLILLDEIGSSTAPEEGAAIAVGFIEYILHTHAKAIVTTHYPQLKEYAMRTEGIMNAGMQFDADTLRPTYRLLMGYPGASNALETAEALGLPEAIIKKAREQLERGKDANYETVLKKAFEMKSRAEKELAAAEDARREAEDRIRKIAIDEKKLSDALERINANARAETKRLVNNAAEKANNIIEEIKKELHDADERALLKAKKDLKRIEALAYDGGEDYHSSVVEDISPSEIAVGKEVIVQSFGLRGIVASVRADKKQAEVNCNGKLIKVGFADLGKPAIPAREHKDVRNNTRRVSIPTTAPSPKTEEVNVIGQSVSDAIFIIEPILDNAPQTGLTQLRIVHGKGTGVLGRGIQSFLKSHPMVKSYRYGRYGEGDNGVTIVELV